MRAHYILVARRLAPSRASPSGTGSIPPAVLNNTRLSRQQVADLRTELERALKRLQRRTSSNGHAARELDQSSIGRLSRIEALQNQGLTRKLEDRERTQLNEVLQALARLDSGTYGLCNVCNGAIGIERLFVVPETRTCGECPNG